MNPSELIDDLRKVAVEAGFQANTIASIETWPVIGLRRLAKVPTSGGIYLSAGIHGDEPAGPLALLELLRENALPHHFNYWICPLLNPSGLARNTRENADGYDLNRDYDKVRSVEVDKHRKWAQSSIDRLDQSLHLHEDWESRGFYLYELNLSGAPSRAKAILTAVQAHLPIETAEEIDGNAARDGMIRRETLPEVPGGDPEAVDFTQRFGGLSYTLETPSTWPLTDRVAAHQAAVLAALDFP